MEFFPLTLGLLGHRPKHAMTGRWQEPEALRLAEWAWREWLGGPSDRYEAAHPSEKLLRRLAQGDKVLPARPWVILGEPGAGKTTLLEHWCAKWPQTSSKSQPGARLPVLLRLRDLPRDAFAGDPASVVNKFWEQGLAASQSKTGNATGTVEALHTFAPVWLLDGIDEMPVSVEDSGFWDAVRALPGEVVLSCRTAAFRTAWAGIAGRVRTMWRIFALRPDRDQEAFLAQAYAAEGWMPAAAAGVVRRMNANAALRPLAVVPAVLRLVGAAGPGLPLPATRAAFYNAVTNAVWARHASGQEDGTPASQPGMVRSCPNAWCSSGCLVVSGVGRAAVSGWC